MSACASWMLIESEVATVLARARIAQIRTSREAAKADAITDEHRRRSSTWLRRLWYGPPLSDEEQWERMNRSGGLMPMMWSPSDFIECMGQRDYATCTKVLIAASHAACINITLDDLQAIQPIGEEVRL